MTMKKIWQKAWNMGAKLAEEYDYEREAMNSMSLADTEMFLTVGCSEFFHAGFIGREPEWVEAIRFGEIPAEGRSINWAEHKYEPGVSCVKIIRTAGDEDAKSIYDVTLGEFGDREKIRVAGWWLGLCGSDGEPTLLGCVRVD